MRPALKTLLGAGLLAAAAIALSAAGPAPLSEAERDFARALGLDSLPPAPPDPSNAVADSPEARELGEMLFNDTGFSANNAVACATCHLAEHGFQDNKPLGEGVGVTQRRTMALAGMAHERWFFWDGHKDSLWSQALGPVESPVEHAFTRSQLAARMAAQYRAPYEALFGPLPAIDTPPASPLGTPEQRAAWQALTPAEQDAINRVFANFGKAIAAFERTIAPVPTRFDRFAAGDERALSAQEIAGFRLFIGKGQCATCHDGPRFTDGFFHNTGVKSPTRPPVDHGRAGAFARLRADPFNCLGPYSDAPESACGELKYMLTDPESSERAFKTPSLRGVAGRAPYMHAGQIRTLAGVVEHYNRAFPAPSGHTEISPLHLTTEEKAALIAFLQSL